MSFLHNEDDISPREQLFSDRGRSVIVEACACCLNAIVRCEDLFRGGTAQSIPAADKQDTHSVLLRRSGRRDHFTLKRRCLSGEHVEVPGFQENASRCGPDRRCSGVKVDIKNDVPRSVAFRA
jgi:hypothetical protein